GPAAPPRAYRADTGLLVACEVVRVPAGRRVAGAWRAGADGEDERPRLARGCGARGPGLVHPDARPGRRVDLLALDRERRVAVDGVVELRLAVLAMIVLGDD